KAVFTWAGDEWASQASLIKEAFPRKHCGRDRSVSQVHFNELSMGVCVCVCVCVCLYVCVCASVRELVCCIVSIQMFLTDVVLIEFWQWSGACHDEVMMRSLQ